MAFRILIVPDKFKGTLTAQAAAEAIAHGWKRIRSKDNVTLLPMSDGGDGFGEAISRAIGAKPRKTKTVNAANESIEAAWWWEPKKKIAIIESAKVIGLAMLPPKKFHPFQLDTFGLGKVLLAAQAAGARTCLIGIGGSATNDAGFGMARSLGWRFLDRDENEINGWPGLGTLAKIGMPKRRVLFPKLIIAVDVKNKLLGKSGCSRVYGPQKGLRPEDFSAAEKALRKFANKTAEISRADFSKTPGSGAAGGLGFGLMAFASGRCESGFKMFSDFAQLKDHLRNTDLVITGEGAIDQQTLMGKGVGEVALLCRERKIPVIALAGTVLEPQKAKRLFTDARGLTDITTLENAKSDSARHLEILATEVAKQWNH